PTSYRVAPTDSLQSTQQAADSFNRSATQLFSSPSQQHRSQQVQMVPPRSQLEALLVEEWSRFLKISSIGIHDSFYDLGGDSLMVLGLLAQIKRRLSIEVPLAALVETPTVAGLADYLQVHATNAVSEWLVPIQSDTLAPDTAPDTASHPAQKQPFGPSRLIEPHLPKTEEPLVACIKQSNENAEGENRPPLFFIHPIGGGISCYTPLLGYLSSKHSLYGIRALGLEGATPPLEDIAQMAQRYIKAIRQDYPEGDLLLGGWSMGGLVAYEMAHQLATQNDSSVQGLILVDSPTAIPEQNDPVMDFVVFARGLGFAQAYVSPMADQLQQYPNRLEDLLRQLLQDGQRQR
ncbi:MAG: alpha/beta fold hydrolase, partial [Cyanobacteria bacterium J06553_1]